MLTLSILVFTVVLLASVISIGIRLAWGATKFIFGLGLFWFCPLLFVLAVLFGGFSHTWLLIVIVGLLFGSAGKPALLRFRLHFPGNLVH